MLPIFSFLIALDIEDALFRLFIFPPIGNLCFPKGIFRQVLKTMWKPPPPSRWRCAEHKNCPHSVSKDQLFPLQYTGTQSHWLNPSSYTSTGNFQDQQKSSPRKLPALLGSEGLLSAIGFYGPLHRFFKNLTLKTRQGRRGRERESLGSSLLFSFDYSQRED